MFFSAMSGFKGTAVYCDATVRKVSVLIGFGGILYVKIDDEFVLSLCKLLFFFVMKLIVCLYVNVVSFKFRRSGDVRGVFVRKLRIFILFDFSDILY